MKRNSIGIVLGISLLVALSCSDEDSADTPSNGDGGTGDTASGWTGDTGNPIQVGDSCDANESVGGFRITLTDSYTTVGGSVSDGVTPSNVARELDSDGACVLLAPTDLTCSPACSGDETCGFDETCIPAPLRYDAGTVTIDGMKSPVSLDPNALTFQYTSTIRDPYPAFDTGATITLSAAGGEGAPFTLQATGVSLITSSASAFTVERDKPVDILWDPDAALGDNAYVHLNFSVNRHAVTTGWIECVVPDTGAYTIPATLVTQLIDLGLSGWPEVHISRRSDASTTIDSGCVDLVVVSQVKVEIDIPGLVSCSGDDECPDGQSCSPDNMICI